MKRRLLRPYTLTIVFDWLILTGYLDIVKLLVKKFKADWKKVDDWGWNILHEAAVNGDKELISFVMKVSRVIKKWVVWGPQDHSIIISPSPIRLPFTSLVGLGTFITLTFGLGLRTWALAWQFTFSGVSESVQPEWQAGPHSSASRFTLGNGSGI